MCIVSLAFNFLSVFKMASRKVVVLDLEPSDSSSSESSGPDDPAARPPASSTSRSTSCSTGCSKKKKRKRACVFKKDFSKKWPCLTQGAKGELFAFCKVCVCEFGVNSGGRNDCKRHIQSDKHKRNVLAPPEKLRNQTIRGFFVEKPTTSATASDLELDVTRSEVMLVELAVELNLPMTAVDNFSKAIKRITPDSEIAKRIQCGRSKATAIAKEIAAKTTLDLGRRLQKQVFTLSTDGSNDRGNAKLFPLVVRTVHADTCEVKSELLSVPVCEGSATGEKIFQLINSEFEVHNIPWTNCLGFGSDNANVMIGQAQGVYGHILRVNPEIISAGCVCHLLHIGAEKGAKQLSLNADQLLIDTYYYLEKSSKRQAAFKNMQVLNDLKQSEILKHVSTRWLSITACLQRILDNWSALFDFFKAEEQNAQGSGEAERAKSMRVLYQSPTNKLYCLFLVEILKLFDTTNAELQSAEPKVHIMQARLRRLLRNISDCFLKPAVVARGVFQLDFSKLMPYDFKADKDVIIGEPATAFMSDPTARLREEKVKQFHSEVKQFFIHSCTYLQTRLPVNSDVLRHATVADPARQMEASFASLRFFLKKVPAILPPDSTMTELQMEFAQYQSTDITSCVADRADHTWGNIGKLKDEDGEVLFKILPRVMCAVFTLPHSSAHCERIFSIVIRNQTDCRSNLGHETLEALLVNKCRDGSAMDRVYSTAEIKDFKSAYYRSLKGSQASQGESQE